MEALLVKCSKAADIDHFLKIWWQVLQDINTGWCLLQITMTTMCQNLLYLYFNYLFIVFQIYCFIKFTIHSCGNLLCFYNCLLSKRNCLCCLFLRNKFFWKYHKKAIVLLYFWKQQSKLCIFLLGKTSIFHKVQNIMYNRFITKNFRCFALHV